MVGAVLAHVMDASTVDMPPPPPPSQLLPLPIFLPFSLPPPPTLPTILDTRTPLTHRC